MSRVSSVRRCVVYSRCEEPRDVLSEISSNSSQRSTSSLPDDVYQQVINLLTLVKSTCGRSPIASAMFMEELSAVIHDGVIHGKVEVRIFHSHAHAHARTLGVCGIDFWLLFPFSFPQKTRKRFGIELVWFLIKKMELCSELRTDDVTTAAIAGQTAASAC